MENVIKQNVNVEVNNLIKKLVFLSGLVLFWILIFFRNLNIVNIPHQVILIYSMVFLLLLNKDQQMAFIMSLITVRTAFQTGYLILFYIIIYVIRNYKYLKMKREVIVLSCLLIWEAFHLVIGEPSINEYFRDITFFIFLAVIMMSDNNKNYDYCLIFKTMAVFMIFSCIILLLNTYHTYGSTIVDAFNNGYRLGFSREVLPELYIKMNANAAGSICNLIIAGLLLTAKEKKVIHYALVVALIIIGALTVSRTFIIVISILLVSFVLFKENNLVKKFKIILGMLFVVGISLFLLYQFAPSILQSFFDRFLLAGEDGFSNRDTGLIEYNRIIFSDAKTFLFGIGMQDILSKVDISILTEVNVPHNGIQEIFLCWGLIGLILMASMFIFMTLTAKKLNKDLSLFNFIPLFVFLADIQVGQFITSDGAIFMLTVAFMLLFVPFKNNKKEKVI